MGIPVAGSSWEIWIFPLLEKSVDLGISVARASGCTKGIPTTRSVLGIWGQFPRLRLPWELGKVCYYQICPGGLGLPMAGAARGN